MLSALLTGVNRAFPYAKGMKHQNTILQTVIITVHCNAGLEACSLMASWLVYHLWLQRPGFEPADWGHCLVFLGKRHFTLTVPLSTQVYKWLRANLMPGGGGGGNPVTGIPSREE